MEKIGKEKGYSICLATDENYVPYLQVALFSLLANRNPESEYDIVILHTGLSSEQVQSTMALAKNCAKVHLRLFDISDAVGQIKYEVGSYLSAATLYRLLLLSDMFDEYERVLYLDSDIIVNEDVGQLFATDLADDLVAAVEELGFRQLSFSKRAVFLNGKDPYNVDNYRTVALKMHDPKHYFNAGVLMLDLNRCRPFCTMQHVMQLLLEKKYFYNDQDVLNMVFDGRVKMLDAKWNYQNCIEAFCAKFPDIYGPMYQDVRCERPAIIHYVSAYKPWKCQVAMDTYYHTYEEQLAQAKLSMSLVDEREVL